MCVVTSIVAGVTSAVMGTLSAVGTAAAGAATALTGIGTVAAGTGIAGSSIGLTGAGLTGILTAGAGTAAGAGTLAGLGSAAASTVGGLGAAAGGLAVDTATALTTKAFGAGAASFAESMSALGAESLASGATSVANSVGVQTASQQALAQSVLNGQMVNGEFIAAAKPAEMLSTVLPEGAAATGGVLLKEGAIIAQAAGGGLEAHGAHQEGKEEAKRLKAQAADEERRAQQELEAAEIEAKDLARRQKQIVGQGKAAAAANGVMLEARKESVPSVWEQDMAAELAWDQEKLFHNASQRAEARLHNANQMRIGARNVRRSGNLKAVTSLLKTGAGMAVSAYGKPSTTLYS